jgi:hypothetical protein
MLVYLREPEIFDVGAILNDLCLLLISNANVDLLVVLSGKIDDLLEDITPLLKEALLRMTLLDDAEWLLANSAYGHFLV